MSIKLSIRRASAQDVELIQELANIAFPATYGRILSPEQLEYMIQWMYNRQTIEAQIAGQFAWFVAYAADQLCGYLAIEHQAEDLCHLQKIYVLPQYQRLGVGAFLFQQAIDYIKSTHATPCCMELNVNRENGAVDFYKRMGMHILRQGDFEIGGGYLMCDYIMSIEVQ